MYLRALPWFALSAAVVVGACNDPDTEILPRSAEKTENVTCRVPARPPGRARTENAFPNLTFEGPTRLVRTEDGPPRWFVAERTGKILSFDDRADVSGATLFADLAAAGRIFEGSYDDGLMGLALHPRFAETGEVFVAYTGHSDTAALEYHIDRARSTDGGRTLDLATLEPMIVFPKVESIHHGGAMAFGPDGMLYIATGDGAMGDPPGNAQRLESPMGKVLRIDVDAKHPYAVPADNPFTSTPGARPEIWALGLRNPWTMSFDRHTGTLWLGDVGQRRWEEINLITRGGNYGWRVTEGTECYVTSTCKKDGFVDPVFTYSHSEGFSITAGFVYRGPSFPALREAFVIADFITGRVSTVRGADATMLLESGLSISQVVEDRAGEILLVDYLSGTVQRLLPDERPSSIPPKLSATGCFDTREGRPGDDLFPYDVVTPLWSDGADKHRWLKLPADGAIFVNKAGKWVLPRGSVTFKTFVVDGRSVETRMFVNHEEGGWAGYSYAWDEDGADATLLEGGMTRDLGGGRSWTYPSRGDCFACHNLAVGRTLGFTTSQMNRDGQIERLFARGAFSDEAAIDRGAIAAAAPPSSIEEQARAYLDVNCGTCHRPTGPAEGLGDLRRERTVGEMSICNVPAVDREGGLVRLAPGDPAGSALVRRMRALGAARMPPVGSAIVDAEGASLIEAWIGGMDKALCPPFSPTR